MNKPIVFDDVLCVLAGSIPMKLCVCRESVGED